MKKKKSWPLHIEEAFALMDATWVPEQIYEQSLVVSRYLQRRKDPLMKARYEMAVFRYHLSHRHEEVLSSILTGLDGSPLLAQDAELRGQYYLNASRYRYHEPDAAAALSLAEKAIDTFRQNGNKKWLGLSLIHLYTICLTFELRVNYEPIELLMEVIGICDEVGLVDEVMTNMYSISCPNVANQYMAEEKYAEALAFLETPYRKLSEAHSPYAFNIRMFMGSAFHFQKEYDKALEIFEELYKLDYRKSNNSSNLYLTGTLLNCALALNAMPRYMEHYHEYIALVRQVNIPYETVKMQCIMAEKEAAENNAEGAMAALAAARDLLATHHMAGHLYIMYHDAEWRAYEHLGDHKAGWEAYRKYEKYTVKNKRSITDKQIEVLRYKIEMANKTKENDLLKMQIERNELELEMAATFLKKKNDILDDLLSFTHKLSKKHKPLTALAEIKKKLIGYKTDDSDRDRINGMVNRNNQEYLKKITRLWPSITNTEGRICTLIKTGLGNKEIASLLATSTRTVETHRSHIRRKLGLAATDNLERFLRNI